MNKQKHLEIPTILADILQKSCCRKRVGEWKSISLGFGKKVFHTKKSIDSFYGEWEVGTYSSNWEIYQDNNLLFSSKEKEITKIELDMKIQDLFIGYIEGIKVINDGLDVKLILNNNIDILFYAIKDEEDTEVVHFFAPNNIYIEFHPKIGWVVENSI